MRLRWKGKDLSSRYSKFSKCGSKKRLVQMFPQKILVRTESNSNFLTSTDNTKRVRKLEATHRGVNECTLSQTVREQVLCSSAFKPQDGFCSKNTSRHLGQTKEGLTSPNNVFTFTLQ